MSSIECPTSTGQWIWWGIRRPAAHPTRDCSPLNHYRRSAQQRQTTPAPQATTKAQPRPDSLPQIIILDLTSTKQKMPLIQELPNTAAHAATPGWAYVPDTGYDPSKAPIVPTSRKRQSAARAQASIAQGESSDTVSARQQNKTARHLAELERENHKDVKIEVPGRARDVAQRGLRRDGRMSANVRRVLQSQKTWANHLADEEALVAQGVGAHAVIESGLRERESGTPVAVNVKRASLGGRRKSGTATKTEDVDEMDVDSEAPAEQAREQRPAESTSDEKIDYLVKIDLLKVPNAAEIEALLSQPPLSFNAARAAPTKSTAPARRFCEMCGYWGRAMCMKCGARVCGLDCKLAHEETSCQRFYG